MDVAFAPGIKVRAREDRSKTDLNSANLVLRVAA